MKHPKTRLSRGSLGLAGALVVAVAISSLPLRSHLRRTFGKQNNASSEDERASYKDLVSFDRRELPKNLKDQATRALEEDAFRRERRFEAAATGTSRLRAASPNLEGSPSAQASQAFAAGAELFQHTFVNADGFGGKDTPKVVRFQRGERGGPDARACVTCHFRGGLAGSGEASDNAYFEGDGDTQESAFARNPKSLVGAGVVELLAREMSEELAKSRDEIVQRAKRNKGQTREPLKAKGVSFGYLIVETNGTLNYRDVHGVNTDFIVRPFGWKGLYANVRDIVEDSLALHHGMQSDWLVAHGDKARLGSFGGDDPDGDGVTHEISEKQITALTLFVALQEVPSTRVPEEPALVTAYAKGREQFRDLGCASCHTPALPLRSSTYRLSSRGLGVPTIEIDLAKEGAEPHLEPAQKEVYLYSDLRRHDMGPDLADARDQRGVSARAFVTPPLWGIARSRPYLHDGRATDLDEAIALHGGEAESSRAQYLNLTDEQRSPLRVFLATLTRAKRIVTR
jgi:Di-haem oxidoreductase, putative peroxidase